MACYSSSGLRGCIVSPGAKMSFLDWRSAHWAGSALPEALAQSVAVPE